MKKFIALLIAIVMAFSLCACGPQNTSQEESISVENNKEFAIPTAGEQGGYVIETEDVKIVAYTTGDSKYVEMSSSDGIRLQCYITPTEMIIVDVRGDETTYYHETFESEQRYTNPLKRIFGSMQRMNFKETEAGSGVYRAEITTTQEVSKVIPYNLYTIKTVWTDGNEYVFDYFDYSNGEYLVAVEAPEEINPILTKDTTWLVDIDNRVIKNSATDESVQFEITKVVADEGVSPSGKEKETVTKEFTIDLTVNDEFEVVSVRYLSTNLDLTIGILYNYKMTKPEIPENAREMTDDEAQDAIFRVYAAESII